MLKEATQATADEVTVMEDSARTGFVCSLLVDSLASGQGRYAAPKCCLQVLSLPREGIASAVSLERWLSCVPRLCCSSPYPSKSNWGSREVCFSAPFEKLWIVRTEISQAVKPCVWRFPEEAGSKGPIHYCIILRVNSLVFGASTRPEALFQ